METGLSSAFFLIDRSMGISSGCAIFLLGVMFGVTLGVEVVDAGLMLKSKGRSSTSASMGSDFMIIGEPVRLLAGVKVIREFECAAGGSEDDP